MDEYPEEPECEEIEEENVKFAYEGGMQMVLRLLNLGSHDQIRISSEHGASKNYKVCESF